MQLQNYTVPGFVGVFPEEIKWSPDAVVPGADAAILLGNPDEPVPFVVRVRLPPNIIVMPHTHPVARTYSILAGRWKLGFGEIYDPARLVTFPA